MKLYITDATLAKFQSTKSLQNTNQYIRDTRLVGFGVRVSNKSVSFIVETKDKLNKTKRKTIGRFPLLSVAEAREKALDTLRELKLDQTLDPELGTAFEYYLSVMTHRKRTTEDYRNIYSIYLSDWSYLKMSEITRDMVIDKYTSRLPGTDFTQISPTGSFRPIAMGWTPPHLSASMCQTEYEYSVNDKEESKMKINRIGVDLAKNVFQLHGADHKGKAVSDKLIYMEGRELVTPLKSRIYVRILIWSW